MGGEGKGVEGVLPYQVNRTGTNSKQTRIVYLQLIPILMVSFYSPLTLSTSPIPLVTNDLEQGITFRMNESFKLSAAASSTSFPGLQREPGNEVAASYHKFVKVYIFAEVIITFLSQFFYQ